MYCTDIDIDIDIKNNKLVLKTASEPAFKFGLLKVIILNRRKSTLGGIS